MDSIINQCMSGSNNLHSIPDISLLLQDVDMSPQPDENDKIGEGSYGHVYLIDGKVHKKMGYRETNDFGDDTFGVDNISEIVFLMSNRVPFIPEIFDVNIENEKKVSLVEEYCGKDLFDLGEILSEEIKYKMAPSILLQMSRILMWMKRRQIAHMDIKPENLCLTKEGNLFLIDWGFVSKVYGNSPKYFGTEKYSDPTYLNSEKRVSCEYDVIGMGLSFYDFLSQSIPSKSKWKHVASLPQSKQQDYAMNLLKEMKTIEKNFRRYLGYRIGREMSKLFRSMLIIDETKRIKSHVIYTNPIFRDLWKRYPIASCEIIQLEYKPVEKYSEISLFVDCPEIRKLAEKIFNNFLKKNECDTVDFFQACIFLSAILYKRCLYNDHFILPFVSHITLILCSSGWKLFTI